MRLRTDSGLVTVAELLAAAEPVPLLVTSAQSAEQAAKAAALAGRFRMRTVRAVPAESGCSLPGSTAILLRPDGYVAWAGDDMAELAAVAGQWYR